MSASKILLKTALLVAVLFLIPGFLSAQNKFTGIVEKDGKYGIEIKKDKELKQIVSPKYQHLKLVYETIEPRVYIYNTAGKWGIITIESGKAVTVTKPEYDHIQMLNNNDNFVFDLKQYYFLVWKAGKVAVLRYPDEGKVVLSQFYDEIGVDTVSFKKHYKRPFMVKAGGLYGVKNIFGTYLIPVEHESYQKLTDRSSNDFYVLKKGGNYRLVIDVGGFRNEIISNADNVWQDREVFWKTGTDTATLYANGIRTITKYREMVAANEAYLKEAAKKEEAQKLKQEKIDQVLNAKYQKKEKVYLPYNKEMYLLIDSFGIKCFNPETAEFVYADKQLKHYYINNRMVFVQSDKGMWYMYPSSTEYKSIKTVHHLVAAQLSDEEVWIFGGLKGRKVYIDKGAEITEVADLGSSIHFVYRLNGKYGYFSQPDEKSYRLKSLPPVFSAITIVSTFQNNPRLELIYNGEKVNAYHDNISMAYGGENNMIKADMYGAKCGNPNCKDGVVGTTTYVEKGKTVTKTYNNTTYMYKGNLVLADVTVTETNPDKLITEKEYCTAPVHSVKAVMLFWDKATGTYKVEKH